MLEAGLPFDGSSIENWQPINESDMILKPDVHLHLWIHLPLIVQ
jgi:Glutamine synthetase